MEGFKKVTAWVDNINDDANDSLNYQLEQMGVVPTTDHSDNHEPGFFDVVFKGLGFGRRQMSIDELTEALVAEKYGMEQEEELSVQQKREEYLADFESMHQFDPVPEEELAERTPEMILSLLNIAHTSKMKFEKEQAEMEEMEISEEQGRRLDGLREIVSDSEDREDALSRLLERLEEMRERD